MLSMRCSTRRERSCQVFSVLASIGSARHARNAPCTSAVRASSKAGTLAKK
ncbi:hypothetical protein D3C75_1127640 [compost metagenome]